jgi:hypothetical protein
MKESLLPDIGHCLKKLLFFQQEFLFLTPGYMAGFLLNHKCHDYRFIEKNSFFLDSDASF